MRHLRLAALTFGVILTAAGQGLTAADTLTDRVAALTKGFRGTVAIYARNLDTGQDFALGADTKVRTASTIKLPILCALEDLVAKGRIAWTTPVTADAVNDYLDSRRCAGGEQIGRARCAAQRRGDCLYQGRPIAMAITVDDMPAIDYSPDNAGEELIWEISKLLMAGLAR